MSREYSYLLLLGIFCRRLCCSMTTQDTHVSYNPLWGYGGKELKRIVATMLKIVLNEQFLLRLYVPYWCFLCKLIFWKQQIKWVRGAGPCCRTERWQQQTGDDSDRQWQLYHSKYVLCSVTILKRPPYQKVLPNLWLKWQLTSVSEGFRSVFRQPLRLLLAQGLLLPPLWASQSDWGLVGVCEAEPNGNEVW